MASPLAAELSIGSRVEGRYRIVRCIGAGGMGAVFEVLDERTRRSRALKTMRRDLLADADSRERFEREVTVTSSIRSEHIAEVLDAGIDEATDTPFIVMELLDGVDLSAYLASRKRLQPSEVVLLLSQLARALTKTHAAGVVHRDLKPGNLFITTREDGSPHLKVLDFGIAKVLSPNPLDAETTMALGTPMYMPPEQIHGERSIGPAADLYAVGHIAFTLLVGDAYFHPEVARGARAYLAIAKGCREKASERASRCDVTLSPAFDAWFARATAFDPNARFSSASELVAALASALEIAVPRPSPPSLTMEGAALDLPKVTSRQPAHAGPVATIELPTSKVAPKPIVGTVELPTVPIRYPDGREQATGTVVSQDVASPKRRRSTGTIAVAALVAVLAGILLWRLALPASTGVAVGPPSGLPSSPDSPSSSAPHEPASLPTQPAAAPNTAALPGGPAANVAPSTSPSPTPPAPPKATATPAASPAAPASKASGAVQQRKASPPSAARSTASPSVAPPERPAPTTAATIAAPSSSPSPAATGPDTPPGNPNDQF